MYEELTLKDETGKSIDLIDVYKQLIPQWDQEQIDELLSVAERHYPDVETFDDLILQTKGYELGDVIYLFLTLYACIFEYYRPLTLLQFAPKLPQDFIKPEILAFDAALRLGNAKQSWETVRTLHARAVQAVRQMKLYDDALGYHLSKDFYGQNIVRLALRNDEEAYDHLKRALYKKLEVKTDDSRHRGRDEVQQWANEKKKEIYSLAHETISKKISRSREEAPPLEAFLPENLPKEVERKMVGLLEVKSTKDAKVISDAVSGKFRVLPNELKNDFLNEIEGLRASKRQAPEGIVSLYASINDETDEGQSSEIRDLKDDLRETVEEKIMYRRTIDSLERELEKPKYIKLKPIYDELKEDPDIYITDLAKKLNIHRNTAHSRREQLKRLSRRIIPKEDLF